MALAPGRREHRDTRLVVRGAAFGRTMRPDREDGRGGERNGDARGDARATTSLAPAHGAHHCVDHLYALRGRNGIGLLRIFAQRARGELGE